MFIFDESLHTLLVRCAGLGIDLRPHIQSGLVAIKQVDPAELSPGEFANTIREAVEERDACLIVIDSLNGFLNAMPDERYLIIHLHELLSYLGQASVATLLVSAHRGTHRQLDDGAGRCQLPRRLRRADALFEYMGEVRQAISVLKKRGGMHERSIREFQMKSGSIQVGPQLRDFAAFLPACRSSSWRRASTRPGGAHEPLLWCPE
jgi:circadian clock protein KaiC